MRWNIKSEFNEGNIIELLLENRGILGDKDISEFTNPLPIMKILKNMSEEFKNSSRQAKDIILKAIQEEKPIIIHGDYDADGICATAIMLRTLRNELNYKNTFAYIPNRFENGYGLSNSSIDSCAEKLNDRVGEWSEALLVTVDTGITSFDEIEYARKKGFEVIITDHHQKPEKLPPVDCLVWNDEVVGAGVAWILSKLLGSKDKRLLGLAAIATVTDLQPLLGYNRSIVKEGIKILNETPLPGIKMLRQVAGRNNGEISTYDLGWVIGPRINATGRMGDATEALLLLLADDEKIALDHAVKLNQLNFERQEKTEEMYELAVNYDKDNLPRVIVAHSEQFHEGIIGLVAAKLVQKYYRPSIVISIEKNLGKGSVRSIDGVDIIAFLREFEDVFVNVGGHPMAAGFTVEVEKLDLLKDKITKLADEYISDDLLEPVIDIDMKIPMSLVDINFVKNIESLKPFGIGNKSPIFVSEEIGVVGVDTVGRDNSHLSLKLLVEGSIQKAIFFGKGYLASDIESGDLLDIVYQVGVNNFNGREYVNITLKDLKKLGK